LAHIYFTLKNLLLNSTQQKKMISHRTAGSSVLSAAFSSASLGSALSVVGLPATVPLGGVGGCFALVSSGLIIANRKLEA